MAVLTCTTMYVLTKNIKKKKNPMKFSTLSAEKVLCILHGHIVVMITSSPTERRQFAVAIPKNTSRYGMLGDG